MVGFADIDITTSLDAWHGQIFSDVQDDISVVNFYKDNSNGLLTLTPAGHSQPGSPAGIVKVTLDSVHPNYGAGSTEAQDIALAEAALEEASAYVNFDAFDRDDDGVLAADELSVYFIIAGYDASGTSKTPNIWAHARWGNEFAVGTKIVTNYGLNGELNDSSNIHPPGVIAHELGHSLLTLPDLYDYSKYNAGLGIFSLMAGGSWGAIYGDESGSLPVNLDAWSRLYLGWAKPALLVADGGTQAFPPALSVNSVVRLGDMPSSPTEYFLVENRAFDKWDRGIDRQFPWYEGDGGLLVLHVDTTVGTNDYGVSGKQGVTIVEANSAVCSPSSSSCRGHFTNLFYRLNNDAFNAASTPSASFYSGAFAPTTLSGISDSSELMSAVLSRYNSGAPQVSDVSISVTGNEEFSGALSCSDPDEDTCAFFVSTQPARGVLALDSATGAYTYTYTAGSMVSDTDSFTYFASDGELTSSTATVSIDVVVPNAPPILDVGSLVRAVDAGRAISIALSASDPEGLPLVFEFPPLPEGSSLNPDTNTFTWNTRLTQAGSYNLTFRVSDTGEPPESTEKTVSVEVREPTRFVEGGGGGCFLESLSR
jgi:M6 family metalloprotease-like protein